jgi:hypothetical protein
MRGERSITHEKASGTGTFGELFAAESCTRTVNGNYAV